MTQSDEVAGLELALAQAAVMIERLQSANRDCIAWNDAARADITALREERDAFRASSEIRGAEIARLRGLIAVHVHASNNDDSAGDTFGALAEAVQDAP